MSIMDEHLRQWDATDADSAGAEPVSGLLSNCIRDLIDLCAVAVLILAVGVWSLALTS
ncbi:hypothetical protein [Pseudochelatococcus sp. G4_1912]|uniref:hypothetical protein n=1 Tax=Pseudochelatococcus sp. G4_1912 TaxID=3114288 RepID=UPI0039C5B580